jgi:hypothetical protein
MPIFKGFVHGHVFDVRAKPLKAGKQPLQHARLGVGLVVHLTMLRVRQQRHFKGQRDLSSMQIFEHLSQVVLFTLLGEAGADLEHACVRRDRLPGRIRTKQVHEITASAPMFCRSLYGIDRAQPYLGTPGRGRHCRDSEGGKCDGDGPVAEFLHRHLCSSASSIHGLTNFDSGVAGPAIGRAAEVGRLSSACAGVAPICAMQRGDRRETFAIRNL